MAQQPEASPERPYLLEPGFLRKLEQAAIASRQILVGRTKGERRSARRGTSVEFADFRAYTPGDDIRYIDWNAFARLQKLFLKLFVEEEDLHVYVLLDASRSMSFGRPTKFDWGVQAAAALTYIALAGGDRVQLFAHAQGSGERSRILRGRGSTTEAFGWLGGLEPGNATSLGEATDWLLRTIPAPGITVVISDLFAPDWEPALARLAAAKGDVCVLQVFSPEEFEPTLQGDLKLVDSETGSTRENTMGASVVKRYRQTRDGFIESVREACFRYGFSHLLSLTSDPVEDVILRQLRRLQVVK